MREKLKAVIASSLENGTMQKYLTEVKFMTLNRLRHPLVPGILDSIVSILVWTRAHRKDDEYNLKR